MIPIARRLLLLLGVVFSSQLAAEDQPTDVSLSLGYRVDSLDWSISGAGNPAGSDPNILSELEWREMDILQLSGKFSTVNTDGVYFRGVANYGWALDGSNRDSDYAGSDRTLEFSRSVSDVDGSRVLDVSGGLGFTFMAGESDQYRINPMVGYSYHRQDLRMKNGNQTLWDSSNAVIYNPVLAGERPLGPFAGLNSRYDAEWYGPWLGADMFLDLQNGAMAFARLEGHLVNFWAEADWNLRTDFAHPVSFEQDADGYGWVLELGWMDIASRHHWAWGVSASLQSWSTDAGTDRTFFSDNTSFEGRLNEVNRSSYSFNVTLSKSFYD